MLPKENKLVTVPNPFDIGTRKIVPVEYKPGQRVCDLVKKAGLGKSVAVIKNGIITEDLEALLVPGDVVHVVPKPQGDDWQPVAMLALTIIAYAYVSPAVGGYMQSIGMSSGAAAMWGTLAATATITAGGMIINGTMAAPQVKNFGGNASESPTYGWAMGQNTAQEGLAIPVIYGRVATWPQVINHWVEVDSNDDQWYHSLLCLGEGKTNNIPTADDIFIDDQKITVLDENSYVIGTTDGGDASDTLGLTRHQSLHQLRSMNKELTTTQMSNVLLHFDGDDQSTDIIDDSVGPRGVAYYPGVSESVNTWTAAGTAALSTDHPFIGSASLNLETSGDYISVDNWLAMALWTQSIWDFECRFRQDSLNNAGIAGQSWAISGGDFYHWGIFYDSSGQLIFQQYKKDNSSVYTVYIDLKVTATLTIYTWHHIRLARSGNTVYIFLDGVLLGSGNFSNTPEYPGGPVQNSGNLVVGDIYCIETTETDYFYNYLEAGDVFEAWQAKALDANNTVRSISDGTLIGQYIGRGQYYSSSGPADYVRYGNCELDEVRLSFCDHLYDLGGFTPPVNAIADVGDHELFTKGVVDSFTVTAQCPYGLYFINSSNGNYYEAQVNLWIAYRKIGDTTWKRSWVQIWDNSLNPVTRQWTFTPSGGRGEYEIRVSRSEWPWLVENPSAGHEQVTCHLIGVDEILNETLTYPNLQLLSVSIKAQEKLSGRFPAIKVISNRTSIEVTNYNGTKMFVDPTNNAYAALDMLTNNVYGVGLPVDRIDQTAWQAWRDWCDGTVAGNKRCQINMVFDSDGDLDKALQHVENCGRAKIVKRGSKISAVIEKPGDAVALFCNENMTPSTCKVTWLRQAEKSDGVEISYIDKDKNDGQETAFWPGSNYHTLTRPPRITRLNIPGINNNEQALREAIFRQQLSESIKRSVSLQTGIEGLPVMVGDVFDFASAGNLLAFSGRLARGASREEQYTGTTIYLDHEVNLDSATFSGNCIIIVRNKDDSINQHTVTGPFDTDTRSITVSASGTFDFLALYIICRSTGQEYQYKVNTITRSNKQDLLINALQYDPSAYYHSNYQSGSVAI